MTWKLVRVQNVEPRDGFIVDVHFTDGSRREINLAPIFRVPFSSRFGVIPRCFVPCESRREQLPGRMARILILMYFSMVSLYHGLPPLRLLTARTNFEEQKV
jgi:hypothetical protein